MMGTTASEKPPPSASALRTKPCRHFQHGHCSKGSMCRFQHMTADGRDAHQQDESRVPTPPPPPQHIAAFPTTPTPPPSLRSARTPSTSTERHPVKQEVKRERVKDEKSETESSEPESKRSCVEGFLVFSKDGEPQMSVDATLERERCQLLTNAFMNPNDAVKLTDQWGQSTYRFPYEHYRVLLGETVIDTIEVGSNCDIVWCCMLYGRREKVMTHLAAAMVLGYQLRTKVQPVLAAKRLRLATVLFVTEESLGFFELSAISHFWGIRAVPLPKVSQSRLRDVSQHLIDSVDAAHVFLKAEAFKMTATVSVIADVDMLILNPQVMAHRLADFVDSKLYSEMLTDCGTAVMQRMDSVVDFDKNPTVREHKALYRPLSYCFAVIRPNKKLSDKYNAAMATDSSRRSGRLSDQDLLSEVMRNKYMELPHNSIMFPSWFNHRDLSSRRAKEILNAMHWDNFDELTDDDVEQFIDQFGAVHFSNVFSPYTNDSLYSKREQIYGAGMGKNWILGKDARGLPIKNEDFTENFLIPLWEKMRERVTEEQDALIAEVSRVVGPQNPTPGLAKALMALTLARLKKLERTPQPPRKPPGRHWSNDGTGASSSITAAPWRSM